MQTERLSSMELLLADEAYISDRCRQLRHELREITHQREHLAQARPRLGFLRRKQPSETAEQLLQESEESLVEQLSTATRIHAEVERVLRPVLESYLDHASTDFGRRKKLAAETRFFESHLPTYMDRLQALAREIAGVRSILGVASHPSLPRFSFQAVCADLLQAARAADEIAEPLQRMAEQLPHIGGPLFAEVRLDPLPVRGAEVWVRSLEYLEEGQLAGQLAETERRIRDFVATDGASLRVSSRTARAAIDRAATQYLEMYWQQLRDHARENYTPDLPHGNELAVLTARYLSGVPGYTAPLEQVDDPYFCER